MTTSAETLSNNKEIKSLGRRVDFVVCTRNNRDVIGLTLEAIARQQINTASCTVVDGLSTDGTPDFIRENYAFADVIIKDRDSGPGASRNLGMSRGSAEWVVLVDSDVELGLGWVENQIAFMEREGVDVACGKLVYSDDPETLNAAYGTMNRFGICWNGGFRQRTSELATPRRCLWAISAAMILRRSVVQALGGFDELMFAFHEDSDFGWRANLYGFHVAFNPDAIAYHRVHSTMNQTSMGARITHLLFRNRIRSAFVNYQAINIARYVIPYVLLGFVDMLLRGPRHAKLQAMLWNICNFPDTLRRRREVQSKRKVSDRELWHLFERGIRGPGYDM